MLSQNECVQIFNEVDNIKPYSFKELHNNKTLEIPGYVNEYCEDQKSALINKCY